MSLRFRLIIIILLPLLALSGVIGWLAIRDAEARADARFNRALLTTAFAISRDVAVSSGDALSPRTNALLSENFGGRVFYHVLAPDGVYVTGFATPPLPTTETFVDSDGQQFFDGVYQGRPIRAVRYVEAMEVDGIEGEFSVTVWQDQALRSALVADLSGRTLRGLAGLIAMVALVVWFGVRLGLRPLLELEGAIDKRSASDLTPIQRRVPIETRGIVDRLNGLLSQVSGAMEAKDVFISNAAHQLRNPIAGVVTMSEAVGSAPNFEEMKSRSVELREAARQAGDLANKLLALERAAGSGADGLRPIADLGALLANCVARSEGKASAQNVAVTLSQPDAPIAAKVDETLVSEAVTNLIDNALNHGGAALTMVEVRLAATGTEAEITVLDDGIGIEPEHLERVTERFVQVGPSNGSGLGLAIADAVARHHKGHLTLASAETGGLAVRLVLPFAPVS